MAFGTGTRIEIVMGMSNLGNLALNVFHYKFNAYVGTPDAVQLGQAWWNAVKTTYRAMVTTDAGLVFKFVTVRDADDLAGPFGTYSIAPAEQPGTRPPPAQPQLMPIFNAVGVRQTVATRVTRPGQKRFAYLTESDNDNGSVGVNMVALVNAHMAVLSAGLVLGAPAALTDIGPVVVRKDATGHVAAAQSITGFIQNAFITSQNTRKPGRGA